METLSQRLFGKGAGGGDSDAKPGLEAPRLEEDTVVIAGDSPFELRALEVALDMVSWEEGTAQKQFLKLFHVLTCRDFLGMQNLPMPRAESGALRAGRKSHKSH